MWPVSVAARAGSTSQRRSPLFHWPGVAGLRCSPVSLAGSTITVQVSLAGCGRSPLQRFLRGAGHRDLVASHRSGTAGLRCSRWVYSLGSRRIRVHRPGTAGLRCSRNEVNAAYPERDRVHRSARPVSVAAGACSGHTPQRAAVSPAGYGRPRCSSSRSRSRSISVARFSPARYGQSAVAAPHGPPLRSIAHRFHRLGAAGLRCSKVKAMFSMWPSGFHRPGAAGLRCSPLAGTTLYTRTVRVSPAGYGRSPL